MKTINWLILLVSISGIFAVSILLPFNVDTYITLGGFIALTLVSLARVLGVDSQPADLSLTVRLSLIGLSAAIVAYLQVTFGEGAFDYATFLFGTLGLSNLLVALTSYVKYHLDAIDADEDEHDVPSYPTALVDPVPYASDEALTGEQQPDTSAEPADVTTITFDATGITLDSPGEVRAAPVLEPVLEPVSAPEPVKSDTTKKLTTTQARKLLMSKGFQPDTFPGSRVLTWENAANFYVDLRYIFQYKSYGNIAALAEDYGISARTAMRLIAFIDERIEARS